MNNVIIRGRTLSFTRRPDSIDDSKSYNFIEDGALLVIKGIISKSDSFTNIIADAPKDITICDHRPHLICSWLH